MAGIKVNSLYHLQDVEYTICLPACGPVNKESNRKITITHL